MDDDEEEAAGNLPRLYKAARDIDTVIEALAAAAAAAAVLSASAATAICRGGCLILLLVLALYLHPTQCLYSRYTVHLWR